ncbi:MAG: dihydroorotate dehydrogenase (quinone) [Candidatus Pelagibacter sp.]|nr:dihydroorotate dehydrogenase (quinone) [Candidatus Pelagibacter sp.]|tara:strand:- start:13609 stop:14658 length:1050 start_codon:yes stop_codon:yes gene_type:complete
MFSFLRPFIFNLDPETAHDLAIKSLKYNFLPESLFKVENEEVLNTTLFGKEIQNPIGLAAGFDKSAEVYNKIFKLGFGFVEVGTVTPRQQYGNEKPRIFRLERDNALINRLGFNNDGSEIVKKRIEEDVPNGLLGINIGPNKDTSNMTNDFIECAKTFFPLGDYITINISSPNTEGLRDFHNKEHLKRLLSNINLVRETSNFNKSFLLKVSPDLDDVSIDNIVQLSLENNIDGLILTNTTDRNRENLLDEKKNEKGGLSGKPIQALSTSYIKKFYKKLNGKIPIIGVGGIDSGKSAFEKISAGASALQLYTAMIYKGPKVVKKIKEELITLLKKEGFKNVAECVGSNLN